MLGRCRRRRPNIKPALVRRLVPILNVSHPSSTVSCAMANHCAKSRSMSMLKVAREISSDTAITEPVIRTSVRDGIDASSHGNHFLWVKTDGRRTRRGKAASFGGTMRPVCADCRRGLAFTGTPFSLLPSRPLPCFATTEASSQVDQVFCLRFVRPRSPPTTSAACLSSSESLPCRV